MEQAIRRSFAPGRLAGVVALTGGPARKPNRDARGWYVLLGGERRRLDAVEIIRRPGEPDEFEFLAKARPSALNESGDESAGRGAA